MGDRLRLLSVNWLMRGNHKMLIIKLCVVVFIQTILGLEDHVRGGEYNSRYNDF